MILGSFFMDYINRPYFIEKFPYVTWFWHHACNCFCWVGSIKRGICGHFKPEQKWMIIIQINSVYFPSGLNRPRIPSISHVLGSLPSLACTPAIAQQYPFAISDQQALLGTTQEDFISNVAASWLDNSDLLENQLIKEFNSRIKEYV